MSTTTFPRCVYHVGDLVFSRTSLYNDGGIPDCEPDALLAAAGTRGRVVRVGHAESDLATALYAVQFEGPHQTLGPAVGCLTEELTQREDEIQVHRLSNC